MWGMGLGMMGEVMEEAEGARGDQWGTVEAAAGRGNVVGGESCRSKDAKIQVHSGCHIPSGRLWEGWP